MALALTRWPTMSAAEKLADCYNLTTTQPMAGPTPVVVLFSIRCGLYLKGESAALPPEEAAAVRIAGFAS